MKLPYSETTLWQMRYRYITWKKNQDKTERIKLTKYTAIPEFIFPNCLTGYYALECTQIAFLLQVAY